MWIFQLKIDALRFPGARSMPDLVDWLAGVGAWRVRSFTAYGLEQ